MQPATSSVQLHVRAAAVWEEQAGALNLQPRAEAFWGLLLPLEAFIELQHLSWVITAGVMMQAHRSRAGSSPRAQSGPASAVFGCHMEDHTKRVQPVPLPAMQQNLNYMYPQIFWVDGCADASTSCHPASPVAPFPPPVPDRRKKPKSSKERSSVSFLVIFLLILLALTGAGLSMFQIFHLEKELAELREVKSACWPHRLWGETGGSDTSAMPVCVGLFVTVTDCSVGDWYIPGCPDVWMLPPCTLNLAALPEHPE